MPELEDRLTELGRYLDYPATPNLAAGIRGRLEPPPRVWRPVRWRLGLVAAAALLIGIGTLIAIPTTRDAIAGFFGIKGVIIQRVPSNATPTPTGTETSLGKRLQLGREVTLETAQAAISYPIVLPSGLGRPDAIYLIQPVSRQAIVLVYFPRPGLPATTETGVGALIVEFPGSVAGGLITKTVEPGTSIEEVIVRGTTGYWISGRPHSFYFTDQRGNVERETLRLAGNTLLWNQGRLTIRIESGLNEQDALAIANSMR
jgi:hypothetical protein